MQPGIDNAAAPERDVTQPLVLVVDDDAALCEALCDLLLSAGYVPVAFSSTAKLMASHDLYRPGCLVLDVRMPGVSGLDLQRQLDESGIVKPIIFLTGFGDIPMTVQAMKAGAVDFLTKPVRDQTLLDAVSKAILADANQRASAESIRQVVDRADVLTPREWEVMSHVAHGRLNKQIAYDLGISEVTVKLHRGNMMRKMQVVSVGELIRAWEIIPDRLRTRYAQNL